MAGNRLNAILYHHARSWRLLHIFPVFDLVENWSTLQNILDSSFLLPKPDKINANILFIYYIHI